MALDRSNERLKDVPERLLYNLLGPAVLFVLAFDMILLEHKVSEKFVHFIIDVFHFIDSNRVQMID